MDEPTHFQITVIGTGYLGITHAACMAELGYDVLGVDVDAKKIKDLARGILPIFEPGLQPLLRKQLDSGRLKFTTSYTEAAAFGDVHFICVGTPQRDDDTAADLTQLKQAMSSLARHLDRRCLVIGKSTVPVGTAAEMAEFLEGHTRAGAEADLAWCPEFLREGFAVEDTLHPDRLVFGVRSEWAERTLRRLFRPMIASGCPVVVTDLATAELAKEAANAFLATKISFINAMAEISDAVGANVSLLADAIGHDVRIGRHFLNAGLGFGGGCLPKDIRALQARATELGIPAATRFLAEVDLINTRCRQRAVDRVVGLLAGKPAGRAVTILGAAFKPDSDDVRDSPALAIAERLYARGASVTVHDPQALGNTGSLSPAIHRTDSLTDALRTAEVTVLATEWQQYRALEPQRAGELVRARRILDARNVLDPARWRAANWDFASLGRP